jgi:hypothetical protein
MTVKVLVALLKTQASAVSAALRGCRIGQEGAWSQNHNN